MATVRLTTKEVQADSTIYSFGTVREADAFEACVAAADVEHCELAHRPLAKRSASHDQSTSASHRLADPGSENAY